MYPVDSVIHTPQAVVFTDLFDQARVRVTTSLYSAEYKIILTVSKKHENSLGLELVFLLTFWLQMTFLSWLRIMFSTADKTETSEDKRKSTQSSRVEHFCCSCCFNFVDPSPLYVDWAWTCLMSINSLNLNLSEKESNRLQRQPLRASACNITLAPWSFRLQYWSFCSRGRSRKFGV